MIVCKRIDRLALGALAALALTLGSAPAALGASPWWHVETSVRPAILKSGEEGVIGIRATNVGDAPTSLENSKGEQTPVVIAATLPPGFAVRQTSRGPGEPEEPDVSLHRFPETNFGNYFCREPSPRHVLCSYETLLGPLLPFEYAEMSIVADVEGGAASAPVMAEVTGGGTSPASVSRQLTVGEAQPAFGVEEQGFSVVPEEEGGAVDARAGSHPFQLTTNFALNQTQNTLAPPALPRDLRFNLPAGLVANAAVFPRCDELAFLTKGPGTGFADQCPSAAAVGVVDLTIKEPVFGSEPTATWPVPVFNLAPKRGEPVRFGFYFNGIAVTIDFSIRTGGDYGAVASVSNVTQVANFLSESLTIWGVPGDPAHDEARGWGCLAGGFYQFNGRPPCTPSAGVNPPPFLTLPTSCARPFSASVEGLSWPTKAAPAGVTLAVDANSRYSLRDEFGRALGLISCNEVPFGPSIVVAPDVQEASTSTGLSVRVHVPQEVDDNARGLANSSVKDITVALPEGVSLNPAGANQLEACSEGLVGFTGAGELDPSSEPGNRTSLFTPTLSSPFCPTAAKIGTVDIASPLLPSTQHLKGAVYVATQNENPFGSLLALYLLAEDPVSGVVVKLAGEVSLTATGQLISTFKNSPQLPFEDAELHFFGGERAPLATPPRCGAYTTVASFAPWSHNSPVSSTSTFQIVSGPHGSPCPGASLPFEPSLTGGATSAIAGAFSPLTTTIGREDGNQDMQAVQLHMPPGVSGLLSGVKLCGEAQANEGTCGPESLIGETVVSAGVGSDPVSVTGGRVYLTERYDGAPFGLSIVNPVKAGPFDLEHDTASPSGHPACDCVVVRGRIEVDPLTAALTAVTDASGPHAIPHLIDGVPVQIKKVNVTIDRPRFTFNPTNCDGLAIGGSIASDEGASSPVSVPFQVTNCAALAFRPSFQVSTSGRTSRRNGASLHVKLAYPKAPFGTQTNIESVKVNLPRQLPSRLETLQKACPHQVFEANPARCPAGSIVGHAVVHTQILPVPLEGPAYFVSHGGEEFPNLIVVLQGYGVTVELVGDTFIKHGVTSSTFRSTPDVPFETFELTLPEGRYSALAANTNLCSVGRTALVRKRVTVRSNGRSRVLTRKVRERVGGLSMPTAFTAQNGAVIHQNTQIKVTGCR